MARIVSMSSTQMSRPTKHSSIKLTVGVQNMNDIDLSKSHSSQNLSSNRNPNSYNRNSYNGTNNYNENQNARPSGNTLVADTNIAGSHKQEQFGQILTDANVGNDLVMEDIVNDIGDKDDQLLPGTATDAGNGNNGSGGGYVTPMGPTDAELDKIVANETENGNGNGIENNNDQGGEMDVELAKEDVNINELAGGEGGADNDQNDSDDVHNSDDDVLHVTPGNLV